MNCHIDERVVTSVSPGDCLWQEQHGFVLGLFWKVLSSKIDCRAVAGMRFWWDRRAGGGEGLRKECSAEFPNRGDYRDQVFPRYVELAPG